MAGRINLKLSANFFNKIGQPRRLERALATSAFHPKSRRLLAPQYVMILPATVRPTFDPAKWAGPYHWFRVGVCGK